MNVKNIQDNVMRQTMIQKEELPPKQVEISTQESENEEDECFNRIRDSHNRQLQANEGIKR